MTDKTKTDETTEIAVQDESLFSGLAPELVSRLNPAKTRMIMLYLTGHYSKKKIGQIIGVSENSIHIWLLDSAVQSAIKEIQQKEFMIIDSQLKALKYKAVDTMTELLESEMDNVRYQAAKDILDRGGHRPEQSIKVDKTVTTLEQQLASLADFTISDSEVIDITDLVEEVKGE